MSVATYGGREVVRRSAVGVATYGVPTTPVQYGKKYNFN